MAWITKKRDRWAVGFYDQDKKRRLKVLPKGAKKKDAQVKLREIETQVENRAFMSDKETPLFSQVARDWVRHKKTKVRATTGEVYEGHVENHFAEFDGLKINAIDTPTVEKWIDRRGAEGMPTGTVKKILVSLNQIFAYAKRHKLITSNPLTDAEKPKGRKKQKTILNPAQVKALLLKTDHVKYRVLFFLAVFTGARQGELLGLKWSDIDFDRRQVHVQRTFNGGRFFDPKTEKSDRWIDLAPMAIDVLKEWQTIGPQIRHSDQFATVEISHCGKSSPGENLIFPNEAGNPINHNNMMFRHYHPALKRAKLPRVDFNSLRHTNASIRIENGENPVYIAGQMGHSVKILFEVYAHLFERKNPGASMRLQEKLFKSGDHLETKTFLLAN